MKQEINPAKDLENFMRVALLCTIALFAFVILSGCATQPPPRVIVPAPALREVFRGGEIQGLENNAGHYMGAPGDYDQVQHVCTSTPIYDAWGRYVRTSVNCW